MQVPSLASSSSLEGFQSKLNWKHVKKAESWVSFNVTRWAREYPISDRWTLIDHANAIWNTSRRLTSHRHVHVSLISFMLHVSTHFHDVRRFNQKRKKSVCTWTRVSELDLYISDLLTAAQKMRCESRVKDERWGKVSYGENKCFVSPKRL